MVFRVLEGFEPIEDASSHVGAAEAGPRPDQVKYVQDASKYELFVGQTLTWRKKLDWRMPKVDHQNVFTYYRRKVAWGRDYAGTEAKPRRRTGLALQDGTRQQISEWGRGLIWVLANGRFYSHLPKVGRFHHTSFTQGSDVTSAGMWLVVDGQIGKIAPLSGHYKPKMAQFMSGIAALQEPISHARSKLMLWHDINQRFEELEFEAWTEMTWNEIFDIYRTNRQEPRPRVVPAFDMNDLLSSSDSMSGYAEPNAPAGSYFTHVSQYA